MIELLGKRAWIRGLCSLIFGSVLATPTLAAPSLERIGLEDASGVRQGALLVIEGAGFGEKEDAAPVLFDHVSYAYENGVRNDAHSHVRDMEPFPIASENKNAIWVNRKSNVFYATSRPKRHEFVNGSYYLKGADAWFGLPVAYGGISGWDTPTDNTQLYVSWWYKNRYNSTHYWRFLPETQSGKFIPGEKLTISSGAVGTFVGLDSEGLINAVLYESKNSLKGAKIEGVRSGASTVFPAHFRGGSGTGYQTPGSKLARIWDDPSGHGTQGIRSSIALHDFYVSTPSGYESAKVYDMLKLPPEKWVHLEYELDTAKGVVRMYEDGRFRGEDHFDPEAVYKGKYSPTLSLIGTNAKQLRLQESDIAEIYVDKTLQRVVIGNAAKYSDVTHRELQRPVLWGDGKIKVEVHLGALTLRDNLHLYVLDGDSSVNEQGFPLCVSLPCASPPEQTSLSVE